MRHIFLTLLILCALLSSACSFATDFAVVNGSDQPIEVRYQVDKQPADPVSRLGQPFLIKASPFRPGISDEDWLPEGQYQVDRQTGTIIVRLLPGEVLRLTWVKDYIASNGPPALSIEEINITGAYGEIRLRGKQASRAFEFKTDSLFTLTYK